MFKKFRFQLFLKILAITAASIFACEIALRILPHLSGINDRVYDLRVYYSDGSVTWAPGDKGRHRIPGSSSSEEVAFNSYGFRGAEPLLHPDFRLMVVGDSIPFGGGLPEGKIFPRALETSLRRDLQDSSIEILNLGIGDTALPQYVANIRRFLPLLPSNSVLVTLYYNDAMESVQTIAGSRNAHGHSAVRSLFF